MSDRWHSDGPCPFLTCQRMSPHDHPVCPACGAVRFGNAYCEVCKKHRRPELVETDDAPVDRGEAVQ